MLVIRKAQLKAFEQPLLEAFIGQSADYVTKYWQARAEEYANGDALRAMVARCIRRGRALGFRDRGHLTTLLDWECEFGPGFAEKPEWDWLNEILTSDVDHASRIYRIENRLRILRGQGDDGVPTLRSGS